MKVEESKKAIAAMGKFGEQASSPLKSARRTRSRKNLGTRQKK